MLTSVSNNIKIPGYSVQQNTVSRIPQTPAGPTGIDEQSAAGEDTVSISQEAQSLQNTYQKKETRLEEKYTSDKDQLERAFQQEKARLQQEYNLKKQSLGISVFA